LQNVADTSKYLKITHYKKYYDNATKRKLYDIEYKQHRYDHTKLDEQFHNTTNKHNNVEKTLMASETVLRVSDMNLLTLDTN